MGVLCLSCVDVVIKVAFEESCAAWDGVDWGDALFFDEFVDAGPSDFEVGAGFVQVE